MHYVYYTYEKLDTEFSLDELVVYETFEKAVIVAKELLQKELEYIKSSLDEEDLDTDIFFKKEKEFFKATISNDNDTLYHIVVKKIPSVR